MNKKILIVDDEPLIREVFRDALEIVGLTVMEAENGRHAFRLIQEVSFSCVISDVRMPGGDGIELAANIFNMPGEKPKVFLVTGHMDVSTQRTKDIGVVNIFDKPFNFATILREVQQAIADHSKSMVEPINQSAQSK